MANANQVFVLGAKKSTRNQFIRSNQLLVNKNNYNGEKKVNNAKDGFQKQSELAIDKSDMNMASISTEAAEETLYGLQAIQNGRLKKSQNELPLANDYYRRIFISSPIALLTLNVDGVIQKANRSAERLLGVGSNGLINNKFDQYVATIDHGGYQLFITDIMSGRDDKAVKLRINCLNNNKNWRDCQGFTYCNCSPETCLHNDGFVYVECHGACYFAEDDGAFLCMSVVDITESEKANETIVCLNERLEQKVFQQTRALTAINEDLTKKVEQLKSYKRQIIEREEKLNSIFNAAVEGIVTITLSGAIVSINNAVENIFGYSKDELISCNINKLIPLSRQKYHTHHQSNVLGIGFSSMIGKIKEVTGVRKDNTTMPLDVSIAKFSIDGTSYLTCIVRDVTARKLQEQRDQEHLDELAYVTRLGLMGEMASGIAHEVNQPLTAIASYSQVCLNLIQNDNYDQALLHDILQKTNQQALKAGHIIHCMRDFVKAKRIHRSNIDINDLVCDSVGLCDSYLKQNGITIKLQLKKRIPAIYADSIQIEQVILNLIRNSVDALMALPRIMPRGLSIQTALNSGRDIKIRIKDNGLGIDIAEQKNILTPFYTTKSDGMGMGLSICRSIVEAHDGVLHFNSKPGKGTTFYFTLPLRRKDDDI